MATIDKDALVEQIDRLLKEHNYAREDWFANAIHNTVWDAPEAEPTVIRSKTLFPTKDFKEWAKRIKEANPNAVVIPCDAEVASAEAVQGWIPCSERLPDERQDVYVTVLWDDYGDYITAYGMRTRFGWHLHSNAEGELIKGYTVIAWMPLPEPYTKGDNDEER